MFNKSHSMNCSLIIRINQILVIMENMNTAIKYE